MSKYLDYDGLSYFKEKLDENLVDLTSDQTINGGKTFNDSVNLAEGSVLYIEGDTYVESSGSITDGSNSTTWGSLLAGGSGGTGSSSTTYYQHIVTLQRSTSMTGTGSDSYDQFVITFTFTVVNDSSDDLTLSDIQAYLYAGYVSPSTGMCVRYNSDGIYSIGTPTHVFYESKYYYVAYAGTYFSTGSMFTSSLDVYFTSTVITNCTIVTQTTSTLIQ